MSQVTNKSAVLGFTHYGTMGPGEQGVKIPAVYAQVQVSGAVVVVGEPVYCSLSATLAATSQTSEGDALFYEGWLRSAPATTYKHAGMIGVVREIVSQDTNTVCVVQLQGVCDYAKVDTATAANNGLVFSTAGELDVAVAGDAIVAYALAADTAGVAPILLLGAFRGFLGPVV